MTAVVRVDDEGRLHLGRRVVQGEYLTLDRHPASMGPLDPTAAPFRFRQYLARQTNGWAVSVLWGSCTYSSNYDIGGPFVEAPAVVEVAVVNEAGALADFPDGATVAGYVGADEVAALVDAVEAWPSGRVGAWPPWCGAGGG